MLSSRDKNGPRYQLDETGTAKRVGRFDDPGAEKPIEPPWRGYLYAKWLTFRDVFGAWSPVDEESIRLYVGIIRKTRDIAVSRYPGAEFHHLLWELDADQQLIRQVAAALEDGGIRVHRVSDIIPDYQENRKSYQIPVDGHPTPEAYEKIAGYLVASLVEVPGNVPLK